MLNVDMVSVSTLSVGELKRALKHKLQDDARRAPFKQSTNIAELQRRLWCLLNPHHAPAQKKQCVPVIPTSIRFEGRGGHGVSAHIMEDGQVAAPNMDLVWAGGVLHQTTTLKLVLERCLCAYVGVCVQGYKRESPEYKGGWCVNSHGELHDNDVVKENFHSGFGDGAKVTVRYVPGTTTTGTMEWWVDGQQQKPVTGIDAARKGVRFIVWTSSCGHGGHKGTQWRIIG
jgi:hypothetical protein